MSKLVRLWVFLAIMGSMTACADSPTGLANECGEGIPDPNALCDGGGG